MNENLNLVEILKDVPRGTELWSPIFGRLVLESSMGDDEYPIEVMQLYGPNDEIGDGEAFTKEGFLYGGYDDAECVLFPSREQRDWSKFVAPKQKVKVVLHPFDQVLVKTREDGEWFAEFVSHYDEGDGCHWVCIYMAYRYVIPYNEQTFHLIGTTDPCPIDYEIEFSKEYKPF